MRPKTMYWNNKLKDMYIYTNHVISTTPKEQHVHVTWWMKDSTTGKITSMNIDQELWIKSDDEDWVPMDDNIIEKVWKSWRV